MKKALIYLVTTVLIPIVGMTCWIGGNGGSAQAQAWFEQAPDALRIVLVLLILSLSINVLFGPTIYAFWRNKVSRGPIFALNIIFVILGLMLGLFPTGFWLWIWAIRGARGQNRKVSLAK
jgi:hypothetical protein